MRSVISFHIALLLLCAHDAFTWFQTFKHPSLAKSIGWRSSERKKYGAAENSNIIREPFVSISLLPSKENPYIHELSSLPLKDILWKFISGIEDMSKHQQVDFRLLPIQPTINRFIMANPVTFLKHPEVAKKYGFDIDKIYRESNNTVNWEIVAKYLPIIYIADYNKQYGSLGYQLNAPAGHSLKNMLPMYRALRTKPVYRGGHQNAGNSFCMLHRRQKFPENREYRTLPNHPEWQLFFSPNIAMANELCLTDDATPDEFKFFQYATIWTAENLDQEHKDGFWWTIQAPLEFIFQDDDYAVSLAAVTKNALPLWTKVLISLSDSMIQRVADEQHDDYDEEEDNNSDSESSSSDEEGEGTFIQRLKKGRKQISSKPSRHYSDDDEDKDNGNDGYDNEDEDEDGGNGNDGYDDDDDNNEGYTEEESDEEKETLASLSAYLGQEQNHNNNNKKKFNQSNKYPPVNDNMSKKKQKSQEEADRSVVRIGNRIPEVQPNDPVELRYRNNKLAATTSDAATSGSSKAPLPLPSLPALPSSSTTTTTPSKSVSFLRKLFPK